MSTMRAPGRAIVVRFWIIDMLRYILIVLLMTAFVAPASASVWSRLDVLEKRVDALSRMSQRIDKLQAQNSRLNGEIEELKYQLEQMKEQQKEMYLDIERRLGDNQEDAVESHMPDQVDTPADAEIAEVEPEHPHGPGAVSQSVSASAPQKGEQEQYRQAYDLLMIQRDFQRAIEAFQALLKVYPEGRYADNAQFWLGEAYYAKNELDKALKEFQGLVDNYTDSPKVPDAVYKVGYIHKAQGDVEKARTIFEGLIEHYPDSPAARLAAIRLEAL